MVHTTAKGQQPCDERASSLMCVSLHAWRVFPAFGVGAVGWERNRIHAHIAAHTKSNIYAFIISAQRLMCALLFFLLLVFVVVVVVVILRVHMRSRSPLMHIRVLYSFCERELMLYRAGFDNAIPYHKCSPACLFGSTVLRPSRAHAFLSLVDQTFTHTRTRARTSSRVGPVQFAMITTSPLMVTVCVCAHWRRVRLSI